MAYFNKDNDSRGNRSFGKPKFGNDRPQLYQATCANCGKACEVPFKPNGSKPVLCRDCFKNAEGSDSRGAENRFDRKMFDAVCSNCGNNCKIPFRPTEGREVLCSNCFEKNGPIDTRKPFEKQSFNRDDRYPRVTNAPDYKAQFETLNAKMDQILAILHKAMTETLSVEPEGDEVVEEITQEVPMTAPPSSVEKKPKKAAKKTTSPKKK